MGSSSLVIGAIGARLGACFSRADDGGPGDGMGTNGEAEVGRTGVLVEARCVDVQGRHGDVVIVDAGACGSYIDTTKLFVSEGNPDHDSWGEMSPPPGTPRICESWASGSGWPSAMVSLERWNDGTS